jgi:DNA repair protein RAD50
MRASGEQEEERLIEALGLFKADLAELKKTQEEIIKYELSNPEDQKQEIEAKMKRVADSISSKRKEANVVIGDLNKRKSSLQDQDRKKKQLVHNITIIESTRKIADLEREKRELERKTQGLESISSLFEKLNAAEARKAKEQELKFRTEGRWSELVEQIRTLKVSLTHCTHFDIRVAHQFALQRKLTSPEYKDIDERCRKTTIEHTTTLLAAEDLKKYYSAIDKVSAHATRYPLTWFF